MAKTEYPPLSGWLRRGPLANGYKEDINPHEVDNSG